MTENLSRIEAGLRKHIEQLCKYPRTPHSPGYYGVQDYLRSQIRACGLESQDHLFDVPRLGTCTNIYTEIGETSSPRILLGAHYETRDCSGPGADDNASACAVLLELLPLLKQNSKFSFTVVFFDMEEIFKFGSLRGSKAFAKDYDQPLERVIILDTVGGNLAPHFENVFLQFGNAYEGWTHPALEYLALPLRVLEPAGSIGARSDYDAFRRKGIPFTFISSGTPWYYHTPYDLPEILNYKKMAALTETVSQSLSQPLSEGDGRWKDFQRFAELLCKTPELQSERVKRFAQTANKRASRIDIAFMYMEVLPNLRKWGPKLWEKSGQMPNDRKTALS